MNSRIPVNLVEGDEGHLYARQPKVYPREVKGRFQRLRNLAMLWLLGMYYLIPWLNWDGHQAVLFDLPHRKFYILGLVFWPQDFFYMAWLLIMAALSLFFFTALAGRLWCGYACPQTVWTEAFFWIERKVEGDRNQRLRLDKAPWTAGKFARKGLKQLLWILFALWTGFTFVGFFTPIRELAGEVARLDLGGWEMFWIVFYGFATYGNAGFLREQVCKYMCPYARFQSAMFDRNTLIISYDEQRGEPRGHRKRGVPSVLALAEGESAALGDCIECQACVQVCPTGIDIRNGLQVGCIACAACIDACDDIMDKLDYPRGLIRYTTENALEGQPSHILRPRTLIYGTVLTVLLGLFAWGISHRSMLLADVLRDRNALWRNGPGNSIENSYTLKVVNKRDRPLKLVLGVQGAAPLVIVGQRELAIAGEQVVSVPLTLRAPAGSLHGRHRVTLRLDPADVADPKPLATVDTAFYAPQEPR